MDKISDKVSRRGVMSAGVPAYFPDLAFAFKLFHSEVLVLADDLPFRVQSAVHRGRIKSAEGLQWLTVPVLQRGREGQLIRDVRIAGDHDWRRRHWKALSVNYRPSPFFEYYADFFEELYRREWIWLMDLNLALLEYLMKALGIRRRILRSSQMGLPVGSVSERLLAMLDVCGCGAYLSEDLHQKSLDEHLFVAQIRELLYIHYQPLPYPQLFGDFEGGVSVFDLIFQRGPESRHQFRLPLPVVRRVGGG
ncbi:MAG: WbqC family protein [Calditrichaeota bacterium]|nr:WbqC family protein [Calditrichota bacterium]HQU70881.1 WbqC family protein [Calditrichia bacterium]